MIRHNFARERNGNREVEYNRGVVYLIKRKGITNYFKKGGEVMEEGKGVNFILGLLVGALVGASIAILLAPQSGTQTREHIKERAEEFKKKAEKYGKDFKDDAEEWIEKAHHFVDEKGKAIKESLSKKKALEAEKETEAKDE
jgi:gas vesicle protein